MQSALEGPDLATAAVERQIGALSEQTAAQLVSTRQVQGIADAAFSFDTRALRPAAGAQGDRFYATDRKALYVYNGVAWELIVGFKAGTNTTRAAISPDTTDNGYFWWATDTGKLWEVVAGAWVDRFVSLDVTTSYKVAGTKVLGAQGAAVADVASADATDLATALTLVNELKTQVNTLLARQRAHGLIA
jgi:hypothetical protein